MFIEVNPSKCSVELRKIILQRLLNQKNSKSDLSNYLDELEEWAESEDNEEILEGISLLNDHFIRSLVASNSHTSLQTLEKLSKDSSAEVRACTLLNEKASIELFERLSKDKSVKVRLEVACRCDSGVRIDIWTHFMRGCIMKLCTPI